MLNTYLEIEVFFESRKKLGIKPGLKRIKQLLKSLGNPQDQIKAIHIAGTNGKGSTVQFIKNALQANGYQVGVFTSPSLDGLCDHIYLNDHPVDKETFLSLFNELYPTIKQLDKKDMPPTEFEIITALGFMYFSKQADIALIEAGMGGREDTTNCFTPIISIITNISRDHTGFLGNTLAEIAYHKAGIIKHQTPVILGDVRGEALHVIEKEIHLKNSHSSRLGRDFSYKKSCGKSFQWKNGNLKLDVSIQMQGEHQIKNASVALTSIMELQKFGYTLPWEKTLIAINETTIPGRFEIIHKHPLIILDGAHNPASIQSFIHTIGDLYAGENLKLIFAAFKDKDTQEMINLLNEHFPNIIFTTFDHPRAMKAEDLSRQINRENEDIFPDWQNLINKILQDKTSIYCITGSLHFISRVRKYLLSSN